MSHNQRPSMDFFSRNWEDRLATVLDLVREISHHTDPFEMGQTYSQRMMQLFPASRRLSLSRRGLDRPKFRVTRDSERTEKIDPWREKERLPLIEGGLLSELIYAGVPRIINELGATPDDPDYEFLAGQRSMMAIPMFDQGESLNMVVTLQKFPNAFSPEHLPELVWLANLFGRATLSEVLSRQVSEALEEIEQDLARIANIQRSLLPSAMPKLPSLDIAVYYQTSRRAGGDYYDFFPRPDGTLGILIADVSGHGTPAAVHMAITHSLTRAYVGEHVPPGLLLGHLNRALCRDYTAESGTFVTAFYAIYDPSKKSLSYASAGHNPPRVVRCDDGSRFTLDRVQRLPLGVIPEEDYPAATFELVPGDQIIFYTDGITEATNPAGAMFTPERLDSVLAHCPIGAQAMLQAVLAKLGEFTAGEPAEDDRTLLVAKYLGSR